MAKELETVISEPEKTARGASGTFMKKRYPTELTSKAFGSMLIYLYEAGTKLPTVFVDEEAQKLEAVYEDTGLSLVFVVVKQALRVKPKSGSSNVLIAPSLRDAMDFLCELEGHRQGTCTPLMKHPNRYIVKRRSEELRGPGKQRS